MANLSTSQLFLWGLKKAFTSQVSKSQILKSLWKKSTATSVNSPNTLPLDIPSKEDIYANIAKEQAAKGTKSPFLKMNQGFSYAKQLISFYRHGVSVVWQNNKKMKEIRKRKYKLEDQLDRAGVETDVVLPRFTPLANTLAQVLYMNFVENRSKNENTSSDVIRTDKAVATTVDEGLFLLTRAEFQLLKRTPSDFAKIPMFAVLVAIFMEMTPVLCYTFPEVTPSTCVLPSILPRIWNSKTGKKLRESITAESAAPLDDYAMKTAYNMPLEHVHLLTGALRLKSKYIPLAMYPESVLRARLQNYYNYLTVDNYYLSGLNGGGNLWGLDISELVLACLERNLVDDIDALVKIQSLGTLEEKKAEIESLQMKLFQSIANFQNCNIGYLAIGHLLPKPDIGVEKWRNTM
ncbi:CIC11C00000001211 [Sungouiella intermedia]|uniref:CIC11C00000001211 n=1 Tax=Sungouiella intermedia TaxID=45354 RepID=A0A1L0DDU4_9ASCO|nr:CIC11C00000001211 [[Candida] intermedia]